MDDEFAKRYQKLIAWLDPDPARLRRGWQAVAAGISGTDPPRTDDPQLHFPSKCDNLGPEPGHPFTEIQESREEP